jgi:hypothetical protein
MKLALTYLFLSALITATNAVTQRVFPGDSIQDAVDAANSGDTIIVHKGTYTNSNENAVYGVRISKDNIHLKGVGEVRLIATGNQETGIYAAPPGCEFKDGECDSDNLQNVSIKGFSVEEFPENGIQTRWVDGFKIIGCKSINNLGNGIYATRSSQGLIQGCFSSGSLDSAAWVSSCTDVTVEENELTNAPTGMEITVSKDIMVCDNYIHDNTVGVGLYHPNLTRNPLLPDMTNWMITHNKIVNNNRNNAGAPPGSSQASLIPGIGIFVLGVSGHTILQNEIKDNELGGIVMLGYCSTRIIVQGVECGELREGASPSADNNLVSENELEGNGENFPAELGAFLGIDDNVDILCAGLPQLGESGANNCFEKNFDDDELTTFAFSITFQPDGSPISTAVDLPTGGCTSDASLDHDDPSGRG